MGPETQAWISGNFAGQKIALVLLVKYLHHTGIIDGLAYVQAIEHSFNDPEAKFERQSYKYLQDLANSLEQELRDLPRQPS